MARKLSTLTGMQPLHEHDELARYLRATTGKSLQEIARSVAGVGLQELASGATQQRSADYGSFLRAIRDRAGEGTNGRFRNLFDSPALPTPNLYTFLCEELGASQRRASGMIVQTDLDAGPDRAISLSYLGRGADCIRPDVRVTLYPGSDAINLQAVHTLQGEGNIAAVPGVQEVFRSDVLFVAGHIATALGARLETIIEPSN